jgi:hypothetical protein
MTEVLHYGERRVVCLTVQRSPKKPKASFGYLSNSDANSIRLAGNCDSNAAWTAVTTEGSRTKRAFSSRDILINIKKVSELQMSRRRVSSFVRPHNCGNNL